MAALKAQQERDLQAKLKRRKEMLQLKKMKAEVGQADELIEMEIQIGNKKFDKLMVDMEEQAEEMLQRDIDQILSVYPGKE